MSRWFDKSMQESIINKQIDNTIEIIENVETFVGGSTSVKVGDEIEGAKVIRITTDPVGGRYTRVVYQGGYSEAINNSTKLNITRRKI